MNQTELSRHNWKWSSFPCTIREMHILCNFFYEIQSGHSYGNERDRIHNLLANILQEAFLYLLFFNLIKSKFKMKYQTRQSGVINRGHLLQHMAWRNSCIELLQQVVILWKKSAWHIILMPLPEWWSFKTLAVQKDFVVWNVCVCKTESLNFLFKIFWDRSEYFTFCLQNKQKKN